MTEDSDVRKSSTPPPSLPIVMEEIERRVKELVYGDQVKPGVLDMAVKTVQDLSQRGPQGIKSALDLITDLLQELTGVESFKIIPRFPAAVEVDIRCLKEAELPWKKVVGPMVEIEALKVGKRIHFEGLLNQEKKGLQISIFEGFSIKMNHGPLLGGSVVDIKGRALLTRDHRGLIMELTTRVPGTDQEIQLSIPVKQILQQARKFT